MQRMSVQIRTMDGIRYSSVQEVPDTYEEEVEDSRPYRRPGAEPETVTKPLTAEVVAVELAHRLASEHVLAISDDDGLPGNIHVVPLHNVHTLSVVPMAWATDGGA